MPFWKKIVFFPIFGGFSFHLIGACLSGLFFMYLHYKNNFNDHPELILDYLQQLLMIGQLPMLVGFILGIVAAFVSD